MNSLVKSLGRIAKHLPNKTLDDPLNRITVDDRGRVWVTEDTTLVVLKGGLRRRRDEIGDRDIQQNRVRELVELMLKTTGWSSTELAREAGLAPSTLNRFLHDPGVKAHAL